MWLKFMRVCCSTVAHHLGLLLFRRWVSSSFAISQTTTMMMWDRQNGRAKTPSTTRPTFQPSGPIYESNVIHQAARQDQIDLCLNCLGLCSVDAP